MKIPRPASPGLLVGGLFVVLMALSACVENVVTSPTAQLNADPDAESGRVVQSLTCDADVKGKSLRCAAPTPATGGNATIIGGQNTYVTLTSSNFNYDIPTQVASIDVTLQNLLNEAIGTPDGTVADINGIRIFFHSGPTTTGGSGVVTVANADGTAFFTGANQPYFRYDNILAKNQVTPAHPWQFNLPATVTNFSFSVYVSTEVQPLIVINEVLVNPGGTILDASGEWFELYNAGSLRVDLQNYVIADSAASGRRPYHLISSSQLMMPNAYRVFGNTTNTTNNGGVTVDYAYGSALQLANSLDAVKLARVYGSDTLTIDRTQFASPGVSAQNGISRELKNPALDNSNMDGSNWADALVTAVYGPGGRGTPKAQNSTFTP